MLSSPSGAGKSSISRQLLDADDNLFLSVSATSRKRRPGEVEGVDYSFVYRRFSIDDHGQDFMEYAKVFDHYYGTPKAPVEKLAEGRDVLFDIDWQGTQQIKAQARDDLVSVFILPPSIAELERRLNKRGQDRPQLSPSGCQKQRMKCPIIQNMITLSLIMIWTNHGSVKAILEAERLKRDRQIGLTDFVKNLRDGH